MSRSEERRRERKRERARKRERERERGGEREREIERERGKNGKRGRWKERKRKKGKRERKLHLRLLIPQQRLYVCLLIQRKMGRRGSAFKSEESSPNATQNLASALLLSPKEKRSPGKTLCAAEIRTQAKSGSSPTKNEPTNRQFWRERPIFPASGRQFFPTEIDHLFCSAFVFSFTADFLAPNSIHTHL